MKINTDLYNYNIELSDNAITIYREDGQVYNFTLPNDIIIDNNTIIDIEDDNDNYDGITIVEINGRMFDLDGVEYVCHYDNGYYIQKK